MSRIKTLTRAKKYASTEPAIEYYSGFVSEGTAKSTEPVEGAGVKGKGIIADVNHVATGRYPGQPEVSKFIEKYGDQNITELSIYRAPVKKMLTKILNLISGGKFDEGLKETPYDDLFHLSLNMKLGDGDSFGLEKNEKIRIGKPVDESEKEVMKIPLRKYYTVRKFITDAIYRDGEKKFYEYDAFKNNCQDFIVTLLKANSLDTPTLLNFVKQDVSAIAEKSTFLQKLARTVTDLAASASSASTGNGFISAGNGFISGSAGNGLSETVTKLAQGDRTEWTDRDPAIAARINAIKQIEKNVKEPIYNGKDREAYDAELKEYRSNKAALIRAAIQATGGWRYDRNYDDYEVKPSDLEKQQALSYRVKIGDLRQYNREDRSTGKIAITNKEAIGRFSSRLDEYLKDSPLGKIIAISNMASDIIADKILGLLKGGGLATDPIISKVYEPYAENDKYGNLLRFLHDNTANLKKYSSLLNMSVEELVKKLIEVSKKKGYYIGQVASYILTTQFISDAEDEGIDPFELYEMVG